LVFSPTVKSPAFQSAGTTISVPSVALPGRSEYRLGLGMPAKIRRQLQAFSPNLIHLSAPDWLGYAARRFAVAEDIPLVASFHTRYDTYFRYYGGFKLEKYARRYLKHFYAPCQHVYVPSQSMADELKTANIRKDTLLWTRGVNCDRFHPRHRSMDWRRSIGLADADVAVAFVGRLVLEKGLDVFARTLHTLKTVNPNIRPLIVGEGPERERFASKLDHGIFTGFLTDEPLARAYASADIFFNPSVTETFGNVTLEAMASGLACVCADATGSRSLVDHGESGYLVAPDDEAGYGARIAELASDPHLAGVYGAAGRKKALAFDWDAVMSDLVGHYREVLAG
ncbi:MAG: glycosyltransferase family 1 protein, partial [Pseudomonadota bacterium]